MVICMVQPYVARRQLMPIACHAHIQTRAGSPRPRARSCARRGDRPSHPERPFSGEHTRCIREQARSHAQRNSSCRTAARSRAHQVVPGPYLDCRTWCKWASRFVPSTTRSSTPARSPCCRGTTRSCSGRHLMGGDDSKAKLLAHHGAGLIEPQGRECLPDAEFLAWHRAEVFKEPAGSRGGEAYAACAVSLVFPGRSRFGRRCSSSQPLHASVTVRGTGRAPVRYWLTVRRVSPMAVAASVRESR